MLERFELLFAILGGWVASILILIIIKIKRGKKLPPGAIILGNENSNEMNKSGYNLFLLIGMGIISFLTFFVVFLCMFNFWDIIS